MSKRGLHRRQFIQTAAMSAAGVAVGSSLTASSYARILGANDRVRVGVIGFSNRTRGSLMRAMERSKRDLNFEWTALSDIWSVRREEGVAYLKERHNAEVRGFRSNEELYESGMVDAVLVGTADHQHAVHAIEAVEAGCDAYVEKPLANTMEDARAVLDAVNRTGKIVQIGTQRRSSNKYIRANEYLRSGKFGDIVMVEMSWNVNQPGRWRRPDLVSRIREQDTDWKRFLINRPFEPWDPRKYVEFRLFWPYSSGIPDQWLVHQIDTVHWFTDLPRPRSVVANGGIYLWKDGRTNFDTLTIVFDYGPLNDSSKGFQVVYSSRFTNSAGGVKEYYYSNGGMLNLDNGTITPEGGLPGRQARAMGLEENLLPEMNLAEAVPGPTDADAGDDNDTSANMRNWMECVRSRKTPNADIRAGYNHSVALCMTIAAIQSGRRVTFDDAQQEVVVT